MTEAPPDLGDNADRQHDETPSDSGPELVKVEPRPEEDSPVAHDSGESDDSGEGDEIAERSDSDDDDEDDTDDEDDEPKLKYARLTQHLNAVYRQDMTTAFMVAGDKMIIGTDGGNIVRTMVEIAVCYMRRVNQYVFSTLSNFPSFRLCDITMLTKPPY